MAIANKSTLKHYLRNNFNVLFRGLHGIGKTAIMKSVFEEEGLKWKYFSASSMDPWTDLVGVPESKDGELIFIRPKGLEDYEAIFFDELNRAPDKVLNAVMEIIQFKSINGVPLPKLRVVWAAINPPDEDDTYKVNTLDPAQEDRFHVHLDLPYELDQEYLVKKYGSVANVFSTWWNGISEPIKLLVSPRRVEYAIQAYLANCRLEDFLHEKTNIKALRSELKRTEFVVEVENLKTEAAKVKFLSDINNIDKLMSFAKQKNPIAKKFLADNEALIPAEIKDSSKVLTAAHDKGQIAILGINAFYAEVQKLQDYVNIMNNRSADYFRLLRIINEKFLLDVKLTSPTDQEADHWINGLKSLERSNKVNFTTFVTILTDCIIKTAYTIGRTKVSQGLDKTGAEFFTVLTELEKFGNIKKVGSGKTNTKAIIDILVAGKFLTTARLERLNRMLYNSKIVSDQNYYVQ